jgi:primosomal protein N' (replication factor Y)
MSNYEVETLIQFPNKSSVFTYSSAEEIERYRLVTVPFGSRMIAGIVVAKQQEPPKFKLKELILPEQQTSLSQRFLDFADWFKSYYPLRSDELASLFLPSFVFDSSKSKITPPIITTTPKKSHQPTDAQSKALEIIKDSKTPIILEGVVGSGKTIIYFKTAEEALKNGRSALILSPEIPLSEHLYKRAVEFFGNKKVIHYHSEMTPAKRRSLWLRVAATEEPLVIIGPRSAIFLPVVDYGLICVDEFHDNAYKQLDGVHYHANDVCGALAKIHDCKIIYGSATNVVGMIVNTI